MLCRFVLLSSYPHIIFTLARNSSDLNTTQAFVQQLRSNQTSLTELSKLHIPVFGLEAASVRKTDLIRAGIEVQNNGTVDVYMVTLAYNVTLVREGAVEGAEGRSKGFLNKTEMILAEYFFSTHREQPSPSS
jgi:hypothetical protein